MVIVDWAERVSGCALRSNLCHPEDWITPLVYLKLVRPDPLGV